MPKPRKARVSLETTPYSYYYRFSRYVRRAYRYGVDSHTGKSFKHRLL
jgi:hypothetical protein